MAQVGANKGLREKTPAGEKPEEFTVVSAGDRNFLLFHSDSRLTRGDVGFCEHRKVDGILSVDPTQRGWEYVDTLIHEWLHQLLPDYREDFVAESANQLVSMLSNKEVMRKAGWL